VSGTSAGALPGRFAILDRIADPDVERAVIGSHGTIACYRATSAADLPNEIADLDAVAVWHELDVTADILHRLKRCRTVVRAGVGFDSVDIATADKLGIRVVNIPDYGTNDVADHAVMLTLAAVRRLSRYEESLRHDPAGHWNADLGGRGMRRLTGRKVGVVGFGRIGSAYAHRMRAFGCPIAFYDPYLPDGVDKAWQAERYTSLATLFANCDIVSLHTPLTSETTGMVDAAALAYARPDMILVNTSRGAVIDLDAIDAALRADLLAAFAADVLPQEPPDPAHPLIADYAAGAPWQQGRIVLTPHAAFYSDDCERELREKSARAMLDAWFGLPSRNQVNRAHGTRGASSA
jgi:phosphoglycerate dehydrogenase-like enzyme